VQTKNSSVHVYHHLIGPTVCRVPINDPTTRSEISTPQHIFRHLNLLKALIMSVADQQKESFVVFHNESWFTLLDSVGCTQVYRTPNKR
jgi:hypothetical protein